MLEEVETRGSNSAVESPPDERSPGGDWPRTIWTPATRKIVANLENNIGSYSKDRQRITVVSTCGEGQSRVGVFTGP